MLSMSANVADPTIPAWETSGFFLNGNMMFTEPIKIVRNTAEISCSSESTKQSFGKIRAGWRQE